MPRPDANDLQIKSETILMYEPREHSRCEHILKAWSATITQSPVM